MMTMAEADRRILGALRRIEELEAIVERLPTTTDGVRVCIGDTVWIDPDQEQGWVDPWPDFEEGCGPKPFTVASYTRLPPPRDPVDSGGETEWQLVQVAVQDAEPEDYYWWAGQVYSTEQAAALAARVSGA